ncbi:MAG: SBBP repeat-containing protein, partial [Terriglobia bacterium]
MRTMVRTIAVLSLLTLPAGFLYAGSNASKAQSAASAKAKPDVDHGSARHMSRDNASSAPLLKQLGRGPLRFEANAGQLAAEVRFVSRGMSHTLFLTPNEAVLALPGRPIGAQGPESFSRLAPQIQHSEGAVARLRLVGANASPEIIGTDLLPGKSNYLVGNDPKQWRKGIDQYARVRYKDVYPGIDWVYYGNEGQLEYDLVVAPGADPDRITLAMEITRGTNTEALRLDENGDLLLASRDDTVRFHRPRVYQEIDGQKQFITASYELRPQGQVGFKLGSYDPSQTLVIDPFLSFSTYVGGTATDQANAVAVDGSGNIYVTGLTNSGDFPPPHPSGNTLTAS